jgi:cytochrome c553
MPAFAGQLSEEQIRTLADYLYQRSSAGALSGASWNTSPPSGNGDLAAN